jgi:hypothetical protein
MRAATPFRRALVRLREPKWRPARIPAGILLVAGGLLGFFPLVGFWMLPLGLAILAIDIPAAGSLLRKMEDLWRRWRPNRRGEGT